jgi:unsaturated chondroitin disaccharide hydrolase
MILEVLTLKNRLDAIWEQVVDKTARMAEQIGDKCPNAATMDGIYQDRGDHWWTSGFWPGLQWIMYDMTQRDTYREKAWNWELRLEPHLLHLRLDHDVGFQFLPTAVIKYKLTGDEDAKRIGLAAANFLAGRFNLAGRFIRAWNREERIGWSIIDTIMNLPLLFWASEETKDPRFRHIAIAHAKTVLDHFIRQDGSVRHIVVFDPETGVHVETLGGQGYDPNSAWSRGQSWAIYGMANVYRYTGDEQFLNASKRVAHYFLSHLSEDKVPAWDFRVPESEKEPKDSSAAAIAASGLIELGELTGGMEGEFYKNQASLILLSLSSSSYATWELPEHEAILMHATGAKPRNSEVDVSMIYGDYYFVEALAKLRGWKRRIF